MDILIFGGQSNMEGQTSAPPEDLRPVAGAMEYRYTTHSYVPLQHPVGEELAPYLSGACFGLGNLVPDFVDVYRKYRRVLVGAVHTAKGATNIDQWDPAGDIYRTARRKIVDCLQTTQPEPIERRYFIWLQGESDALRALPEEEYLRRLVALKDALKADCGIDRFGIIRVGYFSSTPAYDEAIMRAQERACADDGDFLMLTRITSALSRDARYVNPHAPGHFDNAALAVIAAEAARTLALLASGLGEAIGRPER